MYYRDNFDNNECASQYNTDMQYIEPYQYDGGMRYDDENAFPARGHNMRGNPRNFPIPEGNPTSLPGFTPTPDMVNSGNFQLPPPPSSPPRRNAMTFRVDAGSIRNCVGRFTYIWMDNGNEFWMYPIQVGRDSVSGLRWNHRFGWTYFGVSLHRIDSFMCV